MINKLLREKTDNALIQFGRYFFASAAAFAADFFILFVLTDFLGIYYLTSSVMAFLCGLTVNYIISIRWVFNKSRFENKRKKEFTIFALIGVVGIFLNTFFIWLFTEKFLMYYLVSKVFASFFVFTWNFVARKLIIFR